ncbi:MAG: transketolase [Saprospiraceae bacterium]|nr:MAG: transketolase [Saprospiraceae bacterium]
MVKNSPVDHPSEETSLYASLDQASILKDFEICCLSREASILGRREVLTGKAKFGILGDGKEVPQVALAHFIRKGDFRSGYYRDQTLLFALGLASLDDFFAQLYADSENDPFSGGRQMNGHFATPLLDDAGHWLNHRERINISADISSTAGQMARGLGLALASKKYRNHASLSQSTHFSDQGNEICFCTIGDASTSEGVFWETLNAAGVMQVPLAINVWDDGYGISVPIEFQTTKGSISKAAAGFKANKQNSGLEIYVENGWDYPALLEMYSNGIEKIRATHTPALFHIRELTQPQGHSTSGSHERYKDQERLEWERQHDCILKMEQWILDQQLATPGELEAIRLNARAEAKAARDRAWEAFSQPNQARTNGLKDIYAQIPTNIPEAEALKKELESWNHPLLSELTQNARLMKIALLGANQTELLGILDKWLGQVKDLSFERFHTHLYSSSKNAALNVPIVPPTYDEHSKKKNGYQILNAFFSLALEKYPNLFAFGEDVGHIGDVNQGFAGLQEKFGKQRVFDTGIREWTIMGQAIGMAMRGLRPIAEIQYLDYLIYGLQPLTDDLATLRYRSNGMQQAPAIIRTRGHRLEGIWHAGSPLGMILGALRGIYVLVPRNMTQAAGFYNTMLQSDDPALIIECLNGYRLKERMPSNLGEFTVPLGVPEILQEGTDLTLVTYGSCVRIAQTALSMLETYGISVELIDVQSLLPFDLESRIVDSLKKTNRILFLDEDVPGGATAYMMQEVLEKQKGYRYLDSPPITLTAKAHRTPYGSDGDYFTKPNPEDVFEAIYQIIYEAEPHRLPASL